MTAKQPAGDAATASGRSRVWVLLSPGLRDVAVLLIGAVLGLLAGPMVLGQLLPDAYRNMFIGGLAELRAIEMELERAEQAWEESVQGHLDLAGDDPDAATWLEGLEAQRDAELAVLRDALDVARGESDKPVDELDESVRSAVEALHAAEADRERRLRGMGPALIMACVAVMLVGGVLGGRAAALKPRFITAVCAILAVWLLLHLGRPDLLDEAPAAFAAVVAAIAIIAALLPLPRGDS